MSVSFSLASHRSAYADEGQDGENDDDGSNEPYDAVHDCLLFKSIPVEARPPIGFIEKSSKPHEIKHSDDDDDRADQPNDAVHDFLLLMS
ncbi:hypothetical protein [Neorhizobium galegae]|uniref:hypothetical protein n=1 Tax=Neorhizobium galegae TaxID=399 RepID=UPI0012FF3FA5|nr:hypothetical protein [Neorhizobium galegae]